MSDRILLNLMSMGTKGEKHMPRISRILIPFLVVCLVCLSVAFVAFAPRSHANAQSSTTRSAAHPAISTNCPAPGTANAASMPPLTLGSHPNIVYIVNESTPFQGTLKRYDIVTGAKVEIVKLANTSISEAQVSANGQWLMFVAQVSGQSKLQLVRMDGQFLQTLYCGNPTHVQWSTNQQLAVFEDAQGVYLLNVAGGVVQLELKATINPFAFPRTWLDTTRVYVALEFVDSPAESVALLDTSKGPNQSVQNLQVAFDASTSTPFCWDFDSSFDGKSLFTSQCTAKSLIPGPGEEPCCGPSVIADRSPTGGAGYSYVFVNQAQAFTAVRAVTANTLLFTVGNGNGNTSQNGLWKVGTDGSNPTRLTPSGEFNQFTQFPWSNVSRDSTKYVLQIISSSPPNTTYTLEYGSLSGGSPTVFASITNVQLATVGWTTM
jgi:eukaryotic-like serine/threonine-protein kinase